MLILIGIPFSFHLYSNSLVPRLHSPAFIHSAIKSWGVESGNEAIQYIN